MTLQAALGILTLLYQVPIDLALSHQAVGIVVLTLAVLQAERLTAPARPSRDRRRTGGQPARFAGATPQAISCLRFAVRHKR